MLIKLLSLYEQPNTNNSRYGVSLVSVNLLTAYGQWTVNRVTLTSDQNALYFIPRQ